MLIIWSIALGYDLLAELEHVNHMMYYGWINSEYGDTSD